jgi:molybdopterin synthase catalytic subunit
MVTVLLFASLRDATGLSSLDVEVRDLTTIEQVYESLTFKYPRLKLFRHNLLIALNEEYADWDSLVKPGDEIALFPPVSGGSR